MKAITTLILLSLFSLQLDAKSDVSLNQAVNQVKSEGRVLSAKTVNGRHEIKILTPNGTVKTINKSAGRVMPNSDSSKFNRQKTKSTQNMYSDRQSANRNQNNRNVMKLKEQKAQSRRNVQKASNKDRKTTKPKNKDN